MKMINTITLLIILSAFTLLTAVKHCDGRGGCQCECDWATDAHCQHDDGSCCFACCCGSSPTPTLETYCPSVNDLMNPYGNAQLYDGGWTVHGGGAGATKAAFNLLGGSVEFDFDVRNVHSGVNANIYTISPNGLSTSGFTSKNYCDGAKPAGSEWCVEIDWIESNGNCGGAFTLHDIPGPGNNGCTAWGCRSDFMYNGRASYHVKVNYHTNGAITMVRDGQTITQSNLNPSPTASDLATIVKQYSERGAVIYSSQWVGWVPLESCGKTGDLNSSIFSIKNLRITGQVKQGPKPRKCSQVEE